MNFEERKKLFQEELTKILKKYQVGVYPTNVVTPEGEVMPSIKMVDVIPKGTADIIKTDENKTKE